MLVCGQTSPPPQLLSLPRCGYVCVSLSHTHTHTLWQSWNRALCLLCPLIYQTAADQSLLLFQSICLHSLSSLPPCFHSVGSYLGKPFSSHHNTALSLYHLMRTATELDYNLLNELSWMWWFAAVCVCLCSGEEVVSVSPTSPSSLVLVDTLLLTIGLSFTSTLPHGQQLVVHKSHLLRCLYHTLLIMTALVFVFHCLLVSGCVCVCGCKNRFHYSKKI